MKIINRLNENNCYLTDGIVKKKKNQILPFSTFFNFHTKNVKICSMSLRPSWVKALFPKGLKNCTVKSFFPPSLFFSIPKSHWSWSSFKATLYQLLAAKRFLSNYINISVFKTSEHRSHSTRWLSWLRNREGASEERYRERGCGSPRVALWEI